MLHELTQFAMRHWMLVSAFVIVLILLVLEEVESQGGHGHLSTAETTRLINHEKAVIIDLRDADIFKNGHIIGAKNFQDAELLSNQDKIEKFRKKPIILVDVNGTKAGRVATALKKSGFDNVHVLKGGMTAWVEASMPTVKKK